MTEAAARAPVEVASNCCNGRVGRNLLELAEKNEAIRGAIAPTGVEILRRAAEVGLAAASYSNCCNGRVGRSAMEELITAMGGA